MELINNTLSYDKFYPGRILGNTFTVKNKSTKSHRLTLRICLEDRTPEVIKDHLFDYFETTNIKSINKTFTKHLVEKSTENSNEKVLKKILDDTSDAWYMEDPFTKGLVKNVEIDLEPGEGYNFIVVLKSSS